MTGSFTSWLPKSGVEWAWFLLGVTGQVMFAGRWLVQWLASERRKESVMPVSFWWLSVLGGLMVLIYAIHIRSAVMVLGQWGVFIYARNLVLLKRTTAEVERRRSEG